MAAKNSTKRPAAKNTKSKTTGKSRTRAAKSHEFQAEVAKLLHLMVHSVYSERDVFIRELISNSADACDKLRYEAIARPDLLAGDTELGIHIAVDKKAGTITISDNGIGMSHDELVGNLGTIARSGTKAFMQQAGDDGKDINLIGQFGIGFYSAFMVAEKVTVISRKAGSGDAWEWQSDGTGTFTVSKVAGNKKTPRGTRMVLKLREDAKEFLDETRVEQIVRTYSDHVAYPIMLDGKEPRQLNTASALWTRPKKDITDEQYKEFFGSLSGVFSDPALTIHYKAEGLNEYTVLLFVPGERPFDLFDPERRGRQKLYVRKVFITDDADLLPPYLRFVRGVIDSQDMPLNISREMLQDNPTVAKIRNAVTGRVLSELKKCAEKQPETYAGIWQNFGAVLKEGIYEDISRRDDLFELARFRTTSASEQTVSLKEYVSAMKENQTAIYYVTGEDAEKAASSPHLEGYRARGIDVLILPDPVDSFWVRTALGYDGKPFKSVTQGAADLDNIPLEKDADKDSKAVPDSDISVLAEAMKDALGDKVKQVRKSHRLTGSPVCIVADDAALDRNLEKLLARQNPDAAKVSAPILEINPANPLIKALSAKAKKDKAAIRDAALLLFDQACIIEGEQPEDPAAFARRMSQLMEKAFA